MKLRTRLSLIVSLLLAISIITTAVSLFFNTRKALLDQALSDGEILASIIARTAGMAETVENQTEQQLNQDMLSSARIVSHFVAIAEKAKLSRKEINRHLHEIVGSDNLGEIWVSDPKGKAYLHSKLGGDFQFLSDPLKQPQAAQFWPLLSSKAGVVIQPVLKRESDGLDYKYIGISGIDKPRIIQVGIDGSVLNTLKQTLGTQELINRIIQNQHVEKVWIVNQDFAILHFAGAKQENAELLAPDKQSLNLSMQSGQIVSQIDGERISIAAPIFETSTDQLNAQPHFIGATLLHISTKMLFLALERELVLTAIIAGLVLIITIIILNHFTKSITAPLLVVSDAALALNEGHLNTLLLDDISQRKDELGVLSRVFQEMACKVLGQKQELEETVARRTLELKDKNSLLESAQKVIEDELKLAHSLQQAILPRYFPDLGNFSGCAIMRPAQQLAGDFYDFIELGNGRLGIVIADVADKGVASAFFMVFCSTIIRVAAESFASPLQVLTEANKRIHASNPMELFVTVFYGVLDTETGRFTYANGGHLSPYLFSAVNTPRKLPRTVGMALGVTDDAEFGEHCLDIEPGDLLFLYSDGITEAFNAEQQEFGEFNLTKSLLAVAEQEPDAIIQYLLKVVKTFEGNTPQSDDLTAIVILRQDRSNLKQL
jgi:sigma-B regulation protein RsbU (phosphoserine phosphatase)